MEFEERIRQPGAAAVLGWQLADTLVFQALTGKPDIVAEATRCFDLLDGMKEEWIEKSIARGTLIGAEPGRIAEFLSAVKHYELVAESQFNLPPRFLELSANDEQGGRGALVRLASSDTAMDQKIKQLNRFITSYSPPLCRIAAVNMLSDWAHRDERAAEALVGLLPTFYSTHVRDDDDLSARYSRAVEYSVSRGIVGLGDKGARLFDRLLAEHPRTATHDHLRYLREKMEEAWNPPVPA